MDVLAFVRIDRGTKFMGDIANLLQILEIPVIKISMGYP